MAIINDEQLQNESEIECVKKFIKVFNIENNTNYQKVEKNPVQNEIDVYCHDSNGSCLKIQIKKADPCHAGNIGKSRRLPIDDIVGRLIVRGINGRNDNCDDITDNIKANILKVKEKYRNQGKDMSGIILLMEDLTNPPQKLLKNNLKEIDSSGFKEIWLVPMNDPAFKII
jgi:hypothetical protein